MADSGKSSGLAEETFLLSLIALERYIEVHGVRKTRTFLRQLKNELRSRLLSVGGQPDTSVTALQLEAMLAQVEAILSRSVRQMTIMLDDASKTASVMGARHAVKEFKALEKHFKGTTPVLSLDRASVFKRVVNGQKGSLLRRNQRSVARWGLNMIGQIENTMSVSVATGASTHETVKRIAGKAGLIESEMWQAERIVRTELSFAHGATKQAALNHTAEEFEEEDDPVMKRIIETFDDRTGDDSFVIHGQTVPAGKPFEWKRKRKGAWQLVQFMHPPNRPNDRSVVIPWRASWDPTATFEKPLTLAELRSAKPTRYRKKVGVAVPPGHKPGKPYSYSVK